MVLISASDLPCTYDQAALNAELLGASAVIVEDWGDPIPGYWGIVHFTAQSPDANVGIPVVMVSPSVIKSVFLPKMSQEFLLLEATPALASVDVPASDGDTSDNTTQVVNGTVVDGTAVNGTDLASSTSDEEDNVNATTSTSGRTSYYLLKPVMENPWIDLFW